MVEENLKIAAIVAASRKALETEAVKSTMINLKGFPVGSCADASLLVGNALLCHGITGFKLVSAEMNYIDNDGNHIFKTHAWLENESHLVDITADQFRDVDRYIFIVKTNPVKIHLGYIPLREDDIQLGFTAMAWPAFRVELDKFME